MPARVNARLIEQALVNLLDNAVKFSATGRLVSVEGRREDEQWVLSVRDQGCGIAAEHLPRLFERFYRVDKARSRQSGGTGLGLAIVKHIVMAHGGAVNVESTPGRGSVFSIRLPV
jgi:two-component system phosphate regulon sensor histidine kinase PhoR